MATPEVLRREIKALAFDQYGTIVDMQKGLTDAVTVTTSGTLSRTVDDSLGLTEPAAALTVTDALDDAAGLADSLTVTDDRSSWLHEQHRRRRGLVAKFTGVLGVVAADRTVAAMHDFVCGANREGFHIAGTNFGRDLPEPAAVADLRKELDKTAERGKQIGAVVGAVAGTLLAVRTALRIRRRFGD